MNLSFLKNITVEAAAPVSKKSTGNTVIKEPVDGANFRLYKNGRLFPSVDTIIKYDLQFQPIDESVDPQGEIANKTVGCGLDIFQLKDWPMVPADENAIIMAITPREGNSKIDVFGNTTYGEDGEPKGDVLNNTASTFGKTSLVPMVSEVYGVNWETTDFVDLVIMTDAKLQSPNDVYVLPKTVSRGANKGNKSYVSREFIEVFPLILHESSTPAKQVDLEDSIKEVEKESSAKKDPLEALLNE